MEIILLFVAGGIILLFAIIAITTSLLNRFQPSPEGMKEKVKQLENRIEILEKNMNL